VARWGWDVDDGMVVHGGVHGCHRAHRHVSARVGLPRSPARYYGITYVPAVARWYRSRSFQKSDELCAFRSPQLWNYSIFV
jgi:hypothetical protein